MSIRLHFLCFIYVALLPFTSQSMRTVGSPYRKPQDFSKIQQTIPQRQILKKAKSTGQKAEQTLQQRKKVVYPAFLHYFSTQVPKTEPLTQLKPSYSYVHPTQTRGIFAQYWKRLFPDKPGVTTAFTDDTSKAKFEAYLSQLHPIDEAQNKAVTKTFLEELNTLFKNPDTRAHLMNAEVFLQFMNFLIEKEPYFYFFTTSTLKNSFAAPYIFELVQKLRELGVSPTFHEKVQAFSLVSAIKNSMHNLSDEKLLFLTNIIAEINSDALLRL